MAAQLAADPASRAQLYDLCGQFEQLMLSSLVPQSFFHSGPTDDDEPASATATGATAELFSQALGAALERAGGFGLGHEVFRMLEERST